MTSVAPASRACRWPGHGVRRRWSRRPAWTQRLRPGRPRRAPDRRSDKPSGPLRRQDGGSDAEAGPEPAPARNAVVRRQVSSGVALLPGQGHALARRSHLRGCRTTPGRPLAARRRRGVGSVERGRGRLARHWIRRCVWSKPSSPRGRIRCRRSGSPAQRTTLARSARTRRVRAEGRGRRIRRARPALGRSSSRGHPRA